MRLAIVLAFPLLFAAAPAHAAEGPVVVVELFTSQGCSSCPPADEILSEIGADDGVLPLAFHVDYWNDLGWKDPFSSAQWSDRQRHYASVIGGGSYTPEAVVNGEAGMVGSRRDSLTRAIAAAKKNPPKAKVALTAVAKGDAIAIHATSDASGQLYAAVVESRLVTKIGRGENGGSTAKSDFVVRALVPVKAGDASIPLEKDWNRENLRVAVFAQDPKTLEIQGASPLTKF